MAKKRYSREEILAFTEAELLDVLRMMRYLMRRETYLKNRVLELKKAPK